VVGVLPEVVDPIAHDGGVVDLVRGIQDRQALAVDRIVYGASGEDVEGGLVPLLDPGQRPIPLDVLQPQVRIDIFLGQRRDRKRQAERESDE
jgi:hypothetical protein